VIDHAVPDHGPVRLRLLSLLTAALLLPVGLAHPPPAAAQGTELSAVLSLTPPAGATAQLHRLASRPGTSRAVPALAPAAAHRAAAVDFARRQHLRVLRSGAWTVTVAGDATALAAAFGSQVRRSSAGTWAPDPVVPAALRGHVDAVVGLDSRRAHRPHATIDGAEHPQSPASLRAAYDVPAEWRGTGATVGILSLSGWDRRDVDEFAKRNGMTLRPDQVTAVELGWPEGQFDGYGGEYEAALDAQAVLAVAPDANVRMYFAPNTTAGIVLALNKMAEDAATSTIQVASTSWGACERDLLPGATPEARATYLKEYRDAIDLLVANGASLFAASGDAGAFDCSYPGAPDGQAQVDFPAGYVNTVAVGGTTLTPGHPEIAWSDQGFGGYLGNGSGGGESLEQGQPSYQAGRVAGTTGRLVPDVAAVADPQSGLEIYVGSYGGVSTAGGTSLAAPLWAGMLAGALSAGGRATGLGNLLPALYATADAGAGLADITLGHNGLFNAGAGYDQVTGLGVPRWSVLGPALLAAATAPAPALVPAAPPGPRPAAAAPPVLTLPTVYARTPQVSLSVAAPGDWLGFAAGETVPACARLNPDRPSSATLDPAPYQGLHEVVVTGLDSSRTCHQVTADVVYDSVPPSTTVNAALAGSRVRIGLGGYDSTAGVGAFTVTVRDGSTVVLRTTTADRVLTPTLPAGRTYQVEAVAHDLAGNAGKAARASVRVPHDDVAFLRTGSWSRAARAQDYRGSHVQSQARGATIRLTAVGRAVDAFLVRGPSGGLADLYVDGRRVRRLDLWAPSTGAVRVRLGEWASRGQHTVQLVVLGAHRRGSRGSYVMLDGASVFP
jgi:kumamolisin